MASMGKEKEVRSVPQIDFPTLKKRKRLSRALIGLIPPEMIHTSTHTQPNNAFQREITRVLSVELSVDF